MVTCTGQAVLGLQRTGLLEERKPILTYPLVSCCCEGRVHLDEVLQKRLGAVPRLRAGLRHNSKLKNGAGPPQNTLQLIK